MTIQRLLMGLIVKTMQQMQVIQIWEDLLHEWCWLCHMFQNKEVSSTLDGSICFAQLLKRIPQTSNLCYVCHHQSRVPQAQEEEGY
jgi:hypothetical protein